MKHDEKCERAWSADSRGGGQWQPCRCEVRALEERVAQAERQRDALAAGDFPLWLRLLALSGGDESFGRASVVEALEALVAEWRPVVRSAVERVGTTHECECVTCHRAAALSPAAREAAK